MPDNPQSYVPPSIEKKAFSCPHCGAFAHQDWYKAFAQAADQPPHLITEMHVKRIEQNSQLERTQREELLKGYRALVAGKPKMFEDAGICRVQAANVFFTKCYSCEEMAVWVYDDLAWPNVEVYISPPNADLPEDIKRDYNEAAAIVERSPRGAAALLRLCVQKLCAHLGEPGRNISDDIGSLVRKGLPERVQKALRCCSGDRQ